jgi:hypothetical protein
MAIDAQHEIDPLVVHLGAEHVEARRHERHLGKILTVPTDL